AVTDNGDGTYSAPLSGVAAGVATVTFTVNGAAGTNTADVTLVAVPAAATSPAPAPAPAEASLATTGLDVGATLGGVGMLLGAGVILALAKRKRRPAER
ncbi:Ig-like domain-containing protein, partial [Leifsonia sp. NPDC102414]|uniref:Ig-like domain-containing protein n=1 Tax=Leifsonia sp. NPDC102414 TaxID=3364124 RepID=UPI0038162F76